MTRSTQYRWWRLAGATSLAILVCGSRSAFAQAAEHDQQDAGAEVLASGPIHEAFLPVVSYSADAGKIVNRQPPEAIDELPPNQRPAGDDVAWIPGYWSWDDDRDDFIWVSGIWRRIPPGRQWVPGYWARIDEGYQWVHGYWADAQISEVAYIPEPPAPVDEQPRDPPADNVIWIPGHWVWSDGEYAWRPGYWIQGNPNWTWTPGYYAWTPRGYVYIDGYWDYVPLRRGLIFAPVYFRSPLGSPFSPYAVVSLGVLGNSLFVNPGRGQYYYGNYFAPAYARAGYYPWFSFGSRVRGGFDPVFAYQRWENRDHRGWEKDVQTRFEQHRDAAGGRAPGAANSRPGNGTQTSNATVIPLAQLAKHRDAGELKLQAVNQQERQHIAQESHKVRDAGNERHESEAKTSTQSDSRKPETGKLPQSSIVGKTAGSQGKEAPPAAPKVPEVDRSVTPKAGNNKPESKPETKPAPKAEPKAAPKAEPRPIPKAEPKPEPKAGPKPEPKPAPKVEPKPEPKPAPKPAPKVEPKPEPKPAPKVEPKPEPKPAPKVEPKPEPKPVPKVEPKPEPKPSPGPAPAPGPAPKPEPKPKS